MLFRSSTFPTELWNIKPAQVSTLHLPTQLVSVLRLVSTRAISCSTRIQSLTPLATPDRIRQSMHRFDFYARRVRRLDYCRRTLFSKLPPGYLDVHPDTVERIFVAKGGALTADLSRLVIKTSNWSATVVPLLCLHQLVPPTLSYLDISHFSSEKIVEIFTPPCNCAGSG